MDLEKLAGQAYCAWTAGYGAFMIGAGVTKLFTPAAAVAPLTLSKGAASLMAFAHSCRPQEVNGNDAYNGVLGCKKLENGAAGKLAVKLPSEDWQEIIPGPGAANVWSINEIDSVELFQANSNQYGTWWCRCFYTTYDGLNAEYQVRNMNSEAIAASVKFRINPAEGTTCAGESGEPTDLPPGYDDPITVVDGDSNCELSFSLQGFTSPDGRSVNPVWRIEGAPQPETKDNAGGRMTGGCFLAPTIYISGGGGGKGPPSNPIPIENDDDKDPNKDPKNPWWKKYAEAAVAGVVQAAAKKVIDEVLAKRYEALAYDLVAPCDLDEDGNNLVRTWEFPAEKQLDRVVSLQMASLEVMQQHLDWKTPICPPDAPVKGGRYWRSLAFESEADPDNNYQRTHKRFRYRSNAPGDVGRLVDHWRDFVWNTGPVIVKHTGSPLGTPQVWAASIDEGKRVIRHAAGEAGVNPDQTGEWSVGGTNSPRYGLRATVKLKEVDGIWAATCRQGPSDWPTASQVNWDL